MVVFVPLEMLRRCILITVLVSIHPSPFLCSRKLTDRTDQHPGFSHNAHHTYSQHSLEHVASLSLCRCNPGPSTRRVCRSRPQQGLREVPWQKRGRLVSLWKKINQIPYLLNPWTTEWIVEGTLGHTFSSLMVLE